MWISRMAYGSFTWDSNESYRDVREMSHVPHSYDIWERWLFGVMDEIHMGDMMYSSHIHMGDMTYGSFTWDVREMSHSPHSYDIWERWLCNLMDEIHFADITHPSHVWGTWLIHFTYIWERRDRDIYSIWGGRSLYCLHLSMSQLTGPEACFEIFVRILLGWLSNRSLYQIFSGNPSLLYQAVGTQANDDKSFQSDLSIWKVLWQRSLHGLPIFGTHSSHPYLSHMSHFTCEWSHFTCEWIYLISQVICLISHVICLISHVICLISHVICLISHVNGFFSFHMWMDMSQFTCECEWFTNNLRSNNLCTLLHGHPKIRKQ